MLGSERIIDVTYEYDNMTFELQEALTVKQKREFPITFGSEELHSSGDFFWGGSNVKDNISSGLWSGRLKLSPVNKDKI